MEVVDAFCGAGGFSAGAMAAGCRVTMGIDSDPVPLKLWAANTGGRAVCATIGRDAVDWPEARPGLHAFAAARAIRAHSTGNSSRCKKLCRTQLFHSLY